MAIIIYTYSNPYKINKEPYWDMVRNCFQLCASQTLVNGLCDQYMDFYKGKLVTMTRFINYLYDDWESDITAINQRATLDNIIEYIDYESIVKDISANEAIISLKRNRKYVLESIRVMFELGMEPNNIQKEKLTDEQKCIVAIYEELINSKNKHFTLKNNFSREEIDFAIEKTINAMTRKENESSIEDINKDVIVVHGIHQFSPVMLRTIEALSKYKTVIILFNYLSDYKNVYQTWLNVYSWFESKIKISSQNNYNDSKNYEGGIIADNMAAIISGSTSAIDYSKKIDVIEFDNQTEFSGYVAKAFELAEKRRIDDKYSHPTLYYMDEQIYSANSSVNEILKVFFPEQFGERNFLDYPIGHFFISITNMWDPNTHEMCIKDMNDICECLSCGIVSEKRAGELSSLFDKCRLVFTNETTIKGIIKRLKRLKNRICSFEENSEKAELERIEYYDISSTQIDLLINGLTELNNIAEQFFFDFNDQKNDFDSFYKKIYNVLVSKVLEKEDIDEEFRSIVQRVLFRLDETKGIEASASFDCLRETMQIYLKQTPLEGKGANWIVRNFEQIDGDVLRKTTSEYVKTYHFACLSDQDMSITHKDEFPWPLDIGFFEIAQEPVDWKYQVYVTSRKEYKNFRRYALVYGLAFSKCKIVLSYIKNRDEKENDLYYLLRILNADIKPYEPEKVDNRRKNGSYIDFEIEKYATFTQYDLMKYRLCRYRFLIESTIERNTIYKDEFLIKSYMAVILEHRARRFFSGKPFIKKHVYDYLIDQMEDLKDDFPFINRLDMTDTVKLALSYIEDNAVLYNKFTRIGNAEIDYMTIREEFLSVFRGKNYNEEELAIHKPATSDEISSELCGDVLDEERFIRSMNRLCEKCASKDACLGPYKAKKKWGEKK